MRPFETAGGMQTREFAILNERQATLLITYMRNTDIVRQFKMRLVKRFYELAETLRAPAQPTAEPTSNRELIARALLAAHEDLVRLEAEKGEAVKELTKATQQLTEAKPKADLVDAHYGKGLTNLNRFARTFHGVNSMRIKAVGYAIRCSPNESAVFGAGCVLNL